MYCFGCWIIVRWWSLLGGSLGAILSKWCITLFILELFVVEEDGSELRVTETTISCLIVLDNHVVDLCFVHFSAKLLHSQVNVLLSNLT